MTVSDPGAPGEGPDPVVPPTGGSPENAGDAGHRTPAQQALDLLVYAPAGLVLTAMEDLPDLAAKGRSRLELQFRNAHVIGRMVVGLGQRDLAQRLERVRNRSGAPGPPGAPAPPLSLHREPGTSPGGARAGGGTWPVGAAADPATEASTFPADPEDPGSEEVDAAIAGYDTLSASQVVRRLDGLGPTDLMAVVRHESATRGRRTILHRAQQLLGTEEVPGSEEGPS